MVSIVTPVYNAERWLAETLASVRAQTFTDWEQILVDDGSTDGSQRILDDAAQRDSRFRVLRAACNAGPAAARNLALDAARGRYVAFLDADDLWLPGKLSSCIPRMSALKYDFIYHDYRKISSDGLRVGRLIRGPEELNLRTLHTRRGTGCLSMVIDRQRVPRFRFPTGGRFLHEDFCAWLSLVQNGCVGRRLAADLARYRLCAGSRSADKFYAATESWRIYRHASKLSRARAALWWTQYAWNGFWLHRAARPQA